MQLRSILVIHNWGVGWDGRNVPIGAVFREGVTAQSTAEGVAFDSRAVTDRIVVELPTPRVSKAVEVATTVNLNCDVFPIKAELRLISKALVGASRP